MWQVLGSNQRRLSRRSFSPSLLSEACAADQHGRASRRDSGLPPSAMLGALGPVEGGADLGRLLAATKKYGFAASWLQVRGHQNSSPAAMRVRVAGHVFSAGVRRVVMWVVPPVWMGSR